jgi:hypothetical protein
MGCSSPSRSEASSADMPETEQAQRLAKQDGLSPEYARWFNSLSTASYVQYICLQSCSKASYLKMEKHRLSNSHLRHDVSASLSNRFVESAKMFSSPPSTRRHLHMLKKSPVQLPQLSCIQRNACNFQVGGDRPSGHMQISSKVDLEISSLLRRSLSSH